jgi:hypothetical protein
MFENSIVVLSGDNRAFNNSFLKRFYSKVKEVRVLTNDIFDISYDKYEKIKLFSNSKELKEAVNGSDYLFSFVKEELKELKEFSIHDEFSFNSEKLLKEVVKTPSLKRVIFISDATTSVANDKMLKNIVMKYAKKSTNTAINYILAKNSSVEELLDTMLFTAKNTNNGDIFVKKVREAQAFSERLKSLFSSKTKIEEERESFFTSEEMGRMVDYGKYYKISLESEEYKLNIFADRLKSLQKEQTIEQRELEEA